MIDPLTVVTNGILASASNIIIVDPLGYFVIKIEEVIEEVVVGGGGIFGQAEYEEPKKYKKTIYIKVVSDEERIHFEKKIELSDVELSVKSAKLENGQVKLTIHNPKTQITLHSYEISVDIGDLSK